MKSVGIDLGTTNSVVAAIEGGLPTIITDEEGLRTTPSIVAYTKKQELLIGNIAKRQAVINPQNTFFSVKRFIGSKVVEMSKDSITLPYKILPDKTGNIKIKCTSLNKEFSPEEISSQILKKLIKDAKSFLGQEVTKAVITVPAYFNDSQRQATMDAGKIAGIEVLRIINEPTAASLAYGLDKKKSQKVLVFDLGGGTFDVSILEVGEGVFEVISTAGDTNLGGDDFDKILVNWLIQDFNEQEGIDLSTDIQALQRLTVAAEEAKIELSSKLETKIYLPFISSQQKGPTHIDKKLTRLEFEILSEKLIHRCRIPVEKALDDAQLGDQAINEVVLVGGTTRMPIIQNLVESLTGKSPNQSVNPDEVVAIGAAIQAGVLAGEIKDLILLDIIPLSLGLETLGGLTAKIILRNTPIPAKKSQDFSTANDNQETVEITIVQGEREIVNGNKILGNFLLSGIPPEKQGSPRIEVTFDINVNGRLSVTAKEKKTNIKQEITIENTSTLAEEEISQILLEAKKFENADKVRRNSIDLKNEGERLCIEAEKLVSKLENLEEQENFKKLITSLALKSKNILEVENDQNSVKDLESTLQKVESKIQEILLLSPEELTNKVGNV